MNVPQSLLVVGAFGLAMNLPAMYLASIQD
jgi:hypothetical protein